VFSRAAAAGVLVLFALVLPQSASPRFYPDDPLWTDNDRVADASKVTSVEDSNSYDFVINTLGDPGERRDVRALNVNTVDEVPDSSWFTNRIGRTPMSVEAIRRGPDRADRVNVAGWKVSGGKSAGVQPGFRMTDAEGQIYQIEVDPSSNPEIASGAEIIGTAFYHAMGYNVVDVYPAEIDREALVIADGATIRDPLNGRRRQMKKYDLDNVFNRAARLKNGHYRVLVSRFASGTPLGNFRYYSRRPDDPNDLVLHEHRRELRGARIFGAWLNHDDSRGINSLDMLERTNGRAWVRHYMFDFGSILGSGTIFAQRHRSGNEYIYEQKPGWLTMATLGLYVRPWIRVDYDERAKSVGRFEAEFFDPVKWRPEYPSPAFDNMRADDAFGAARLVSRFSDAAIRGVVGKAQYSEPGAAELVSSTLITRRDKVLRAWLTGVNPIVDATLGPDGMLRFQNAAVQAGVASPPTTYRVRWARFDNAAGVESGQAVERSSGEPANQAPASVLEDAAFVQVQIHTTHPDHPHWELPVTLSFRRLATGGWQTVGLERAVPPRERSHARAGGADAGR